MEKPHRHAVANADTAHRGAKRVSSTNPTRETATDAGSTHQVLDMLPANFSLCPSLNWEKDGPNRTNDPISSHNSEAASRQYEVVSRLKLNRSSNATPIGSKPTTFGGLQVGRANSSGVPFPLAKRTTQKIVIPVMKRSTQGDPCSSVELLDSATDGCRCRIIPARSSALGRDAADVP